MSRLTAEFDVPLDGYFVLAEVPGEETHFALQVEDSEVDLEPQPNQLLGHGKAAGEGFESFVVDRVMVRVSRPEQHPAPPIAESDGARSVAPRVSYFRERRDLFAACACEGLNRPVSHLTHEFHQPIRKGFVPGDFPLKNPVWRDGTGIELESGSTCLQSGPPRPGVARMEFGIAPLAGASLQDLRRQIGAGPYEPKLHEELLAAAQMSAVAGNYRFAVLELATCCEVALARALLDPERQRSPLLNRLVRDRKVRVHIVPFLADGCRVVFGVSYGQEHSDQLRGIEELVNCRNMIIHQGEEMYSTKEGKKRGLDRAAVARWWDSVNQMLAWLRAVAEAPNPKSDGNGGHPC